MIKGLSIGFGLLFVLVWQSAIAESTVDRCPSAVIRVDHGAEKGQKEKAKEIRRRLTAEGFSVNLTHNRHKLPVDTNTINWEETHRGYSDCSLGAVLRIVIRAQGKKFINLLGYPVGITESAILIRVHGS